jgi:glyoxylase-like metal-dependent hydrolase (beta-lactamase superfamily II)
LLKPFREPLADYFVLSRDFNGADRRAARCQVIAVVDGQVPVKVISQGGGAAIPVSRHLLQAPLKGGREGFRGQCLLGRKLGVERPMLLYSCAVMAFTQTSLAKSRRAFAIKVVTPAGDQFWTNSIIIEGIHEVMLVDAQLTKTNAEKVLQEIKATKKPLSIIYITHEHADHFLGLEVFKEAYPGARILANSNVVDRIDKVYQEKIDKWKGILGADATSHTVVITKYDDNFIRIENSEIKILKNVQGDTDANTMLWLPGQRTLIAGDVLFNDLHVYTAETDMTARKRWLNTLNTIRVLKPAVVIPGHSKVGAPIDATSAVTFTEKYLSIFEEELKKAKQPDDLIKAMREKFPSADLLLAIERGANANIKQ